MSHCNLFSTILALAIMMGIGCVTPSAHAQSEELWDLMGCWSVPGEYPGDLAIYKLDVRPGNELKLRLVKTESKTGGYTTGANEYSLAIEGRSLSGIVTWSIYYEATDAWRACRVSPTNFPVTGRISADFSTIYLTWTFPGFDIYSCTWGGEKFEHVLRFTRYQ